MLVLLLISREDLFKIHQCGFPIAWMGSCVGSQWMCKPALHKWILILTVCCLCLISAWAWKQVSRSLPGPQPATLLFWLWFCRNTCTNTALLTLSPWGPSLPPPRQKCVMLWVTRPNSGALLPSSHGQKLNSGFWGVFDLPASSRVETQYVWHGNKNTRLSRFQCIGWLMFFSRLEFWDFLEDFWEEKYTFLTKVRSKYAFNYVQVPRYHTFKNSYNPPKDCAVGKKWYESF